MVLRTYQKICAVVVTHNRLLLLKQCVRSVLNQTFSCDLMIVDNISTDGTREWLKTRAEEESRLHVYESRENLGGAGGFNYGMRWGVEAGYNFVWVMDDDSQPEPDALEKLLEADINLNGNYGFLSSKVLWTDGNVCKMNRQKISKAYYQRAELLQNGIIKVEQATFVSLLFPNKIIYQVGLPIKEFFIWGDDIEYTRRLTKRLKIPCYMVDRSFVIHAMKDNNGSSIDTDVPQRLDRYRYAFRNEAYLYKQEGFKGVCYSLAKCGYNLVRILIRPAPNKGKRVKVLLSSMIRGYMFHPDIEFIQQSERTDLSL